VEKLGFMCLEQTNRLLQIEEAYGDDENSYFVS